MVFAQDPPRPQDTLAGRLGERRGKESYYAIVEGRPPGGARDPSSLISTSGDPLRVRSAPPWGHTTREAIHALSA